jgi:hypothetical protein
MKLPLDIAELAPVGAVFYEVQDVAPARDVREQFFGIVPGLEVPFLSFTVLMAEPTHGNAPSLDLELPVRSKSREQLHADVVVAADTQAGKAGILDVLAMRAAPHPCLVNGFGRFIAFGQVFAGEPAPKATDNQIPRRVLSRSGVVMFEVVSLDQLPGSQIRLFRQTLVPSQPWVLSS